MYSILDIDVPAQSMQTISDTEHRTNRIRNLASPTQTGKKTKNSALDDVRVRMSLEADVYNTLPSNILCPRRVKRATVTVSDIPGVTRA